MKKIKIIAVSIGVVSILTPLAVRAAIGLGVSYFPVGHVFSQFLYFIGPIVAPVFIWLAMFFRKHFLLLWGPLLMFAVLLFFVDSSGVPGAQVLLSVLLGSFTGVVLFILSWIFSLFGFFRRIQVAISHRSQIQQLALFFSTIVLAVIAVILSAVLGNATNSTLVTIVSSVLIFFVPSIIVVRKLSRTAPPESEVGKIVSRPYEIILFVVAALIFTISYMMSLNTNY